MKKTNTTQMLDSFKEWKLFYEEKPIISIDEVVASYVDGDEFYSEAFKLYVAENISSLSNEFEHGLMYCESPIEKMMAVALMIIGNHQMNGRLKVKKTYFGRDVTSSIEHLLIEPQAELGEYRVDFLLTVNVSAPRYGVSNGEEKLIGEVTVKKQMIIECDGHDFHERTKEQAKADKNRDRTLQKLGYLVFRYTGSEIWADVFKCAQEAVGSLWGKANDEAWANGK